MKHALTFIVAGLLLCLGSGCAGRGMPLPPVPPLAELDVSYAPPKPERFMLPDGIEVLLLQNDELPLVRATLYMPGGTLLEAPNEKGVVAMMGGMLRGGGAGDLPPRALDLELEKLAASVSSSYGPEFGTVSFSCLSTDLDRVFELFSKVILEPRFDAERLELARLQSIEDIRRRSDDPVTVGGIATRQLLFGNTVYGTVLRSADVWRIDRPKLLEAYRHFVSPQGAVLAVSGAITRAQVEALSARYLAGFVAREPKQLGIPEAPSAGTPGVVFIRQPLKQATIYIAEVGVPRLTPDWYDILLFNEVFGADGNFSSRLVRSVRSDAGLVYSVQGGLDPAAGRGINAILLQTKSASAGAAIERSLGVLGALRAAPIATQELDEFKTSLINSFVFKFDTSGDIVQRAAAQHILDFPADYDAVYLGRIKGVSPEGVQEVAQNRWHPAQMTIVVVGNEEAYRSISALLKGSLSGYKLTEASFNEALVQ